MNVDGHPQQKHQVTHHKPRVSEPGEVVAGVVCEVAPLQVAVDGTDAKTKSYRCERSCLASRQCSIEKCPATENTPAHVVN